MLPTPIAEAAGEKSGVREIATPLLVRFWSSMADIANESVARSHAETGAVDNTGERRFAGGTPQRCVGLV